MWKLNAYITTNTPVYNALFRPQCMHELVSQAPFMATSEVDNVASLCYRALDGSNYDARCEIAKLLGHLLATTQSPTATQGRSVIQCLIVG